MKFILLDQFIVCDKPVLMRGQRLELEVGTECSHNTVIFVNPCSSIVSNIYCASYEIITATDAVYGNFMPFNHSFPAFHWI